MAPNTIHLTNSTVSTSVGGDVTTGGGNIIDPQFVILQNSRIIAQAIQGAGGNNNITTGVLLEDGTSIIDASSQFGQSGSVTIQSPVSALSQVVNPLSRSTIQATGLLMERCAVRMQEGGGLGSLIVRGRDVAPTAPAGMLFGPLISLSPSPAASGAAPTATPSVVPTPRLHEISGNLLRPITQIQIGGCGA
jgi:hypothetical protein